MDWFTWEPLYIKLANDMNLDVAKDYKIASEFKDLLKEHKPQGLEHILVNILSKVKKNAWIFGAGPSLENDYEIFAKYYSKTSDLIIGVDGATLFLKEQGLTPDIIFSDLDGSIEAILDCLHKGSILILHAHGDNYSLVKKFFPAIKSYNFLATVQTRPEEPFLFNFGGFTDGDRAISSVLSWFNSVNVLLIGFTFGSIQGRYSKPITLINHTKASPFKLQKLTFAKKFIKILAETYVNQIYNLSRPTESIMGVNENFESILFTKEQ